MTEQLTFAGRRFRVIARKTLDNDRHAMSLVRGARLDSIAMEEGKAPEDFAMELYDRAMAFPELFELLGCLMIPAEIDDLDWTPATMRATAEHLRKVHEPEEKRALNLNIVQMLMGFFQSGLVSWEISRKSSSPTGQGARPNFETGATSISETGN